jgi:hypothetical protein
MNKGALLGTVGLIVVLTLAYVAYGRRDVGADPRGIDSELEGAEDDIDPGRDGDAPPEGYGIDPSAQYGTAIDASDDTRATAGRPRKGGQGAPRPLVRGAADIEIIEEEDDPGEVVELPKTIEDHEGEAVEPASPEAPDAPTGEPPAPTP